MMQRSAHLVLVALLLLGCSGARGSSAGVGRRLAQQDTLDLGAPLLPSYSRFHASGVYTKPLTLSMVGSAIAPRL
jgi:hypothetical protein